MSRVVVFTGPTLDEDVIRTIAPNVEVVPPVAAGDLLRLSLEAGDVVAIIDGFYFQSASVRHKEILDLLDRGIHVWGAASMGALRAAELAPFGMRGFGRIFDAYRNGEIDGDDEVAIIHAPQDMHYTKLTEALVNIRYACQAAVSEDLLTQDDYQLVMNTAAELPFFERSYSRIWQDAYARGLSQQVIEELRPFVLQKCFDLKRKDALEMVQALQSPPQEPFHASFELYETQLLHGWRIDEGGFFTNDHWIVDRDLLAAYQLFAEDYPHVHYQLLSKQLAEIAQQARLTRQPSGEKSIMQHDCTELIAQFLSIQYNFPLEGELPASARRWLRLEEQQLPPAEQLSLIGVRLWHSTRSQSWQEGMIHHLKASDMFPSLVKIVYQTHQFVGTIQEKQSGVKLERLLPEKVYAWAMQRWNVSPATFEIALLERGFQSPTAFWLAARSFYLFDKYIGVARFGHALIQNR